MRRALVTAVLRSAIAAERFVTCEGSAGTDRCTYDGFVAGLAMRARRTAEVCKFVETSEASWGRRDGNSEKGGLARRRVVDSGDSEAGELVRNGGRRRSRSISGCGSSAVEVAGRACGFARRASDGAGFVGGRVGFAVEMAWTRRWLFAASRR